MCTIDDVEKPLISSQNLSRVFNLGKEEIFALKDASLIIDRGKFYAIMGPSGSGKTTLLQTLGLLDEPTGGQLFINGVATGKMKENDLAKFRMDKVGFIFQFFHLLPHLNAWENVAFPMLINKNIGKKKRKDKAISLLKSVGLFDRIDHYPNQLSGGEQQRVAIARGLANDPSYILADEPTGNVDAKSEQMILTILKDLCKKGQSIIVVTHNESVAKAADEVLYMNKGVLEGNS